MKNKELATKSIKYASVLLGLGVDGVEIEFKDESFFINPLSSAIFVQELYIIVFNETWLEQAPEREVALAAFHETRHAYQKACIEFPEHMKIDVNAETLKQWAYEFDNYVNFSEGEYENQAIEKDALKYSDELYVKISEHTRLV